MDKQDEVIINDECFVVKLNNKLIVNRKYIRISKAYRNLVLMVTVPTPLFLLIPFDFINGLLVFIYFLIFVIPLSIIYIILKYRKREWHFDKSTKSIRYIKGSDESKILKKINYNDINFLFYTVSESQQLTSSYWHSLFFLILPKQIKIFTGSEESCIRLGVIIGEFLGQSLYYRSGRGKEKIY